VVFTKKRVAVFIDGCFWHGCPEHYVPPKTRAEFWQAKITGNVERDIETTRRLTEAGWSVLRYWEHQDPESVAADIAVAAGSDVLPPSRHDS
jgi:DNA mismatch endonuclease (patch repair protein)